MPGKDCVLSSAGRSRFETQGYVQYSDGELVAYRFGIRLAYKVCGAMVLAGLLLNNTPLLIGATILAFGGTFPPYHPLDYLYNYAIRHVMRKPKIPPRTVQGRFACGIATLWLCVTICFLYCGWMSTGYVLGGILIASATLVSITDICIPSLIYNALLKQNRK